MRVRLHQFPDTQAKVQDQPVRAAMSPRGRKQGAQRLGQQGRVHSVIRKLQEDRGLPQFLPIADALEAGASVGDSGAMVHMNRGADGDPGSG